MYIFNLYLLWFVQNTVWSTISQESADTEENGRHVDRNLDRSASLFTSGASQR